MHKFFGFDPTMMFAERVVRITISLSLIVMMLAPVPLFFILGAGPFVFVFPLLLLPGFYTLMGTCLKKNLFHFIFLAVCTSVTLQTHTLVILPILLFCFLLYFQAERRLYYILKFQKTGNQLCETSQDLKQFCKIYFTTCCKNAIIPTIIGSIIGIGISFCPAFAWYVSSGIFILCICLFILLQKNHRR